MIYLIGGPPRCGKTTLARELSRQTGIPYVPGDYLMSVISPYIANEQREERLPRWYARLKTEKSNDRLYAEHSSREIVDFYLREADTYWPGTRNYIKYALHDGQSLITDGTQLRPDLVDTLLQQEGEENFQAIFLYKTGEKIVSGLKAGDDPKDWAIRGTSEETIPKIAQMIELFGKVIRESCAEYGLSVVDTSHHFSSTIAETAKKLCRISPAT